MNLISWNCRGLGHPRAIRDLCQKVKEKRPTILFLMETKCGKNKMEVIRSKLGFEGSFEIELMGRSGGLALLWKEAGRLEIQNFTRHHINAVVRPVCGNLQWKLTCFYGHPETAKRHESWALLTHLNSYQPDPWLCIGDFNEIVNQDEKMGGALRRESQMDQFREALENCGLSDLGYKGAKFTWSNCQHDGNFIQERLDRAVANKAWCELIATYEVQVLAARSSDHTPLFLQMLDEDEAPIYYSKSFKFEASWLADGECLEVINDAWGRGGDVGVGMQPARSKLASCQTQLVSWSKRKFGNAAKMLTRKTKQLELLQRQARGSNLAAIRRVQKEIDFILEQEDIKWKQRAKQSWYQNGDRNTPFFHAWADHRRRVNRIVRIKDDEGREWKKQHEIGQAFTAFYQKLFTAGECSGVDGCLADLIPRVTPKMNARLLCEFLLGKWRQPFIKCIHSNHPGRMDSRLASINNLGILSKPRYVRRFWGFLIMIFLMLILILLILL
jgi:exonuclease III